MKTIIEPFKIKSVEPLRFTTRKERQAILRKAGYNLFNIHADDVIIDLLQQCETSHDPRLAEEGMKIYMLLGN